MIMDAVVNNGQDRSLVYAGVSTGMHRALTTMTGLPEVEKLVEHKCSGSEGSCASGGAGDVTVGPKC